MVAIKSNILRRMDNLRPGLRKCCIKFVQVVIQCQTPAQVDPRRKDLQDVSSALLPANHPVLSSKNLEPEAEGLLDRILSVFQENSEYVQCCPYTGRRLIDSSDALLIDATLNGFGPLLTTRMTISYKIINAILGFNIFKLANSPMNTTNRILIRSMEKTVARLLNHWLKRQDPCQPEKPDRHRSREKRKRANRTRFQQNPLAARVTEYLRTMQNTHIAIFNETTEASRKRPAPGEPTDGLNDAKRQRLGAQLPPTAQLLPAPPVPPTQFPDIPIDQRARVIALTDDPKIFNININHIPFQMIVQMILAVLGSTPQPALDAALNASRTQILQYVASQTEPNNRIPLDVPADDDYDPLDLKVAEESAQIANRLDMDSAYVSETLSQQQGGSGLGGAQLPVAPLLDMEKLRFLHANTVDRMMRGLDAQRSALAAAAAATSSSAVVGAKAKAKAQNQTNHDRSPYLTFLVRLATRLPLGLELDDEDGGDGKVTNGVTKQSYNCADAIRHRLLQYILQDWRRRIDIAITWLTDEWMADTVVKQEKARKRQGTNGDTSTDAQMQTDGKNDAIAKDDALPNYDRWLTTLLDELSAFIGAETPEVKVLIRLLSEIPSVSKEVIEKVKKLALDPERVGLVVPAFRYLVLYRVPVREDCLDALVDMWRNYEGAKGMVRKDLARWRPAVLEEEKKEEEKGVVDANVNVEGEKKEEVAAVADGVKTEA